MMHYAKSIYTILAKLCCLNFGCLFQHTHPQPKDHQLSRVNPFKPMGMSSSMSHSYQSCQKQMVHKKTADPGAKLDTPTELH